MIEMLCCSYVRAEVLAGFVNGLFLVFISFFIFSEAVEVTQESVCLHLLAVDICSCDSIKLCYCLYIVQFHCKTVMLL